MGRARVRGIAVVAFSVALAGCAGPPPRPQEHREEEWHAPVQILLRYAEPDGKVTRADMEAGLHRDFAAADLNHDGVLEPDEVRAVNEQRWAEDQSAISPLQDWNGDGVVDFDEFAANARSLFAELDGNGDGALTPDELRPGRGTARSPGGEQQGGHGRHGGGGRGGQGGDGGQGGQGGPGGGDNGGD